jgi:BirA family transcriptional regulator, biotin operon repressor / biotin---[acetyl-CoA-carboxylase] ligase
VGTAPGASDERLVAALEGGGWCSGAEVASALGVSRAAVWKGVERLRRRGYEIAGAAGRGYRLMRVADRLLPAQIRRHWRAKRFAGEIVHREVVDSTNRLAAEIARGGAAEGTCVVAERQTAGRGRLGRSWVSPAHRNAYLSLILRPPLPPNALSQLTLVAAVALAETIEAESGIRPGIKWPNDVILSGRKVAGILTELEAEAEQVRFVILGIGVNLNASLADFPPELRRKATSLALAAGRPVDRAAFAGRLLAALEAAYEEFLACGFAGLRERYESFHALVGRRVRVEGARPSAGVVRGIDADGALLVEGARGIERVFAGEVSLAGVYSEPRKRSRSTLALPRSRA